MTTTQKEELVWLFVKLNTISSAIASYVDVLVENQESTIRHKKASLVCLKSAIKYASLSMPEIERVINSLSVISMTMTEQEKNFFKSISDLKDSINDTIENFNKLNLK